MSALPRVAAIATAVPAFCLSQEAVTERIRRVFAGQPQLDRLLPVFARSGVRRRFSAVPLDWFERVHGWPERSRLYLDNAIPLLDRAAGLALDRARIPASEVGAIIVVSTTGITTPSLDAFLIERLCLRPDVQRLPIFGLGCAGGVLGFGRAATLAAAMPDKAVLLLVIELCSLTFRRDDAANSNIVGAALFGDGAAAVVLRCAGNGAEIIAAGEHTWPETLAVMGWEVMDDGLKPTFSRDIPRIATERLGAAVGGFLRQRGLALRGIDRFVVHPGGPKVIDACAQALALPPDALDDARAVLREFGNMSAASIFFVLERALARDDWRRALLCAFGPGFTAGFAALDQQ